MAGLMLHLIANNPVLEEVMKSFLDRVGIWIDICNRSSNIIFDTCIRNNDDWIGTEKYVKNNIVKFVKVRGFGFFIFTICSIKWKMTREIIN